MRTNWTIYLAGPIKGLNYQGAVGWRDEVTDYFFKKGETRITTASPMRHKEHLKDVTILDGSHLELQEGDALSSARGIFARDFWDVTHSDLILCNLIGCESISVGTLFELAWAHMARVPVVLCMDEGNPHEHAFVREACPILVRTLQEGLVVTRRFLL